MHRKTFAAVLLFSVLGGHVSRADDTSLQLQRCDHPETISWRQGNGTPPPPTEVDCAALKAKLACEKAATAPDGRLAIALRRKMESVLKGAAVDLSRLPAFESLSGVRLAVAVLGSGLEVMRCNEGPLSPRDLADVQAFDARASKWQVDTTRAMDAEMLARFETVGPTCDTEDLIEQTRAAIAHERSNPAGVVDLHRLHSLGEDMEFYQDQAAKLAPAYLALRHHAFSGWWSEGACIELRRDRQ